MAEDRCFLKGRALDRGGGPRAVAALCLARTPPVHWAVGSHGRCLAVSLPGLCLPASLQARLGMT